MLDTSNRRFLVHAGEVCFCDAPDAARQLSQLPFLARDPRWVRRANPETGTRM